MDSSQNLVASSQRVQVKECPDIDERQNMREVNVVSEYVTLVAKDETVFMASRDALLKASTFFGKRLSKGTEESKEGIIRLPMISASLMEIILKFIIYNGRTQINNVENAIGLIVAADYLFLPGLKIISEQFLEKRVCPSNCISIFHFAREHNCEELAAKVRDFILSNFAFVAQSKEFMDLSSQELEKWISSDEIVISAEEDVFKIIVRWIAQNKCERTEKFSLLFRNVRLIFVPRDYLSSSIAMNALVKEDASCLDCVTQALRWLDGGVDCHFPWQQLPRKSLQSNVIVACRQKKVSCYFPNLDKWLRLPDLQSEPVTLVSCRGKLFAIAQEMNESQRFEPVLNQWVPLAGTERSVKPQVLAGSHCRNEMQVFAFQGEIYAVVSNPLRSSTFTMKYDFDSNSWKSFPAFNWGQKDQVCIVPTEQFIYAIGGRKHRNPNEGYVQRFCFLSDVKRFDVKKLTWEKLPDIHEARRLAFGTAVQDNIVIAGGIGSDGDILRSCELYNMLENEWQFIANLKVPRMFGSMVCVSERLYVLGGSSEPSSCEDVKRILEVYDQENNLWKMTSLIPFEGITEETALISLNACSAQLFNGAINNLQSLESSEPPKSKSGGSRLCRIM